MLEVGILLVESSSGQEFRKMGSLDSASGEFFIEFPELAPGSYSYGAYGINEIGETQGSVRYIEILVKTMDPPFLMGLKWVMVG